MVIPIQAILPWLELEPTITEMKNLDVEYTSQANYIRTYRRGTQAPLLFKRPQVTSVCNQHSLNVYQVNIWNLYWALSALLICYVSEFCGSLIIYIQEGNAPKPGWESRHLSSDPPRNTAFPWCTGEDRLGGEDQKLSFEWTVLHHMAIIYFRISPIVG